jgi:hypothetical protein
MPAVAALATGVSRVSSGLRSLSSCTHRSSWAPPFSRAEGRPSMPGALSLVGYDNSYLARLRSIWLTSVDSAGFDVGQLAARTLLTRMADPARPAELHLLAPTLQVRGSTAPPPAAAP